MTGPRGGEREMGREDFDLVCVCVVVVIVAKVVVGVLDVTISERAEVVDFVYYVTAISTLYKCCVAIIRKSTANGSATLIICI